MIVVSIAISYATAAQTSGIGIHFGAFDFYGSQKDGYFLNTKHKKMSDSDGIEDAIDNCPSSLGVKALGGCLDSDGDCVVDDEDECPDLAGAINNGGYPVK